MCLTRCFEREGKKRFGYWISTEQSGFILHEFKKQNRFIKFLEKNGGSYGRDV